MSDRTNYTIQLDKDRRDEWADFVENSDDLNTTSELIRRAVSDYIQRSEDTESGLSKEQQEILDALETNTELVRDDIRDFNDILDSIQRLQRDESEEYEVVYQATREALRAYDQGQSEDNNEE